MCRSLCIAVKWLDSTNSTNTSEWCMQCVHDLLMLRCCASATAAGGYLWVHQLQEFSAKQQQLELQYKPVVQQLPTLLQQLRPEELSQAAEFATLQGMREPLLKVRTLTHVYVTLLCKLLHTLCAVLCVCVQARHLHAVRAYMHYVQSSIINMSRFPQGIPSLLLLLPHQQQGYSTQEPPSTDLCKVLPPDNQQWLPAYKTFSCHLPSVTVSHQQYTSAVFTSIVCVPHQQKLSPPPARQWDLKKWLCLITLPLTWDAADLSGTLHPAYLQVTGQVPTGTASSAAPAVDPYGIRIAFRPGHPLSLLTWGQYLAIVSRISKTVEQQLQDRNLDALVDFNSQRRQLVSILHTCSEQDTLGCVLQLQLRQCMQPTRGWVSRSGPRSRW